VFFGGGARCGFLSRNTWVARGKSREDACHTHGANLLHGFKTTLRTVQQQQQQQAFGRFFLHKIYFWHATIIVAKLQSNFLESKAFDKDSQIRPLFHEKFISKAPRNTNDMLCLYCNVYVSQKTREKNRYEK